MCLVGWDRSCDRLSTWTATKALKYARRKASWRRFAVVHFYGLDVWRHVRPGAKKRGGRLSTSVGGGWRRTPRGEPLPAQRPPLPDGVLPGLLLESLGLRSRFLLFCFPSRLVGSLLLFDALVHALADANRRLPRQAKPLLDHWRRRVDALLDVGRRRLGALVPEPAKLPARRQRGGLSCQCAVRADAPSIRPPKRLPPAAPWRSVVPVTRTKAVAPSAQYPQTWILGGRPLKTYFLMLFFALATCCAYLAPSCTYGAAVSAPL